MPSLKIILDGDRCWPDIKTKPFEMSRDIEVAMLSRGMQSGKPSVMIRVNLPDGRVVLAETSLALFSSAARAMDARAEVEQSGGAVS